MSTGSPAPLQTPRGYSASMLFLALLACEAAPPTRMEESPGTARIGEEAPNLSLIGPDGHPFELGHARGEVIFLDLSAFH